MYIIEESTKTFKSMTECLYELDVKYRDDSFSMVKETLKICAESDQYWHFVGMHKLAQLVPALDNLYKKFPTLKSILFTKLLGGVIKEEDIAKSFTGGIKNKTYAPLRERIEYSKYALEVLDNMSLDQSQLYYRPKICVGKRFKRGLYSQNSSEFVIISKIGSKRIGLFLKRNRNSLYVPSSLEVERKGEDFSKSQNKCVIISIRKTNLVNPQLSYQHNFNLNQSTNNKQPLK